MERCHRIKIILPDRYQCIAIFTRYDSYYEISQDIIRYEIWDIAGYNHNDFSGDQAKVSRAFSGKQRRDANADQVFCSRDVNKSWQDMNKSWQDMNKSWQDMNKSWQDLNKSRNIKKNIKEQLKLSAPFMWGSLYSKSHQSVLNLL